MTLQQDLPLSFPEPKGYLPLLPARMVNEHTYCPRLAYLEWVQGEWESSADTVEGAHGHRRVNQPSTGLPPPDEIGPGERLHARSVTLSSERLGLVARMDLIESDGTLVIPVDYKRGKRPHVEKGAYDPERVQLCVQGLLLEEHGYECTHGVLYFIAGKERVRVDFDDELRQRTRAAVNELRLVAAAGRIPPPLVDSPKCARCSLVGICLPDEVNFLCAAQADTRPLPVARDEALPMYVQARGAKVAKKGDNLIVSVDGEEQAKARLIDISQLVAMGNVYVTTPTLHELMRRDIPVSWYSFGGWFLGHTVGTGHKNVELRAAQYRKSFEAPTCLRLAKGLVAAKIANCRTLMRRNWKSDAGAGRVLDSLKADIRSVHQARDLEMLLGVEGAAAARYFGDFRHLIKAQSDGDTLAFDFCSRNRRPPADPLNALLSFAYALLVRAWHVTLTAVGLDPFRGFYHQPRYGRPALALDMMEPFRALIADSTVIQAVNNGEVRPSDFIRAAGGTALTDAGRKRFLAAFERRMAQEVTHPTFGYRVSYRRLLEVQSRLLGRFLLGEIPDYPNFTTR